MNILIATTALMMGMTSCQSNPKSIDLDGEWKVTTIDGEAIPQTIEEVILSFDNGFYHGVTGVNVINGTYLKEDNSLTLGEGAMTKMLGDPISNEVEFKYIQAIHSVKSVADESGKLLLQDGDGKTLMTLERK